VKSEVDHARAFQFAINSAYVTPKSPKGWQKMRESAVSLLKELLRLKLRGTCRITRSWRHQCRQKLGLSEPCKGSSLRLY